jgi:hypothetical protein
VAYVAAHEIKHSIWTIKYLRRPPIFYICSLIFITDGLGNTRKERGGSSSISSIQCECSRQQKEDIKKKTGEGRKKEEGRRKKEEGRRKVGM